MNVGHRTKVRRGCREKAGHRMLLEVLRKLTNAICPTLTGAALRIAIPPGGQQIKRKPLRCHTFDFPSAGPSALAKVWSAGLGDSKCASHPLTLAIRDETTTMSMSCHNIAEYTSTKNAQLLTTKVVHSDERVSRIASPRVDGRPGFRLSEPIDMLG